MLKLKKLHFSGIGRFVDEQSIDFTLLDTLVQVDGQNKNTNGSSGSGKTTVFSALDWLLGINDIPTTVLQSRLTKEQIHVSGEFDWDGQELTISRSKKGLSIELSGQIFDGSSKLTEEKLDQIIGIPRDIFRKIVHKRQKEGGFFLDFTSKKMYEFLTDALNLSEERKKLEKVENKAKELETKKIARQTSLLTLQSGLKATQESILSLGLPPIKDMHEEVIKQLKEKYDESSKRYKEVEEKQKLETSQLEGKRPQVSVVQYDSSTKSDLEQRKKRYYDDYQAYQRSDVEHANQIRSLIAEKTLEQSSLSHQVSVGNTCKTHAAELAGQVKKIRSSICPTCEQSWITETAQSKEREILAKIADYKEKIVKSIEASSRMQVIASELEALKSQTIPVNPKIAEAKLQIEALDQALAAEKTKEQQHLALQNSANQQLLQAFATLQADLRRAHSLEIDQIRGQLEVDRRAFEVAVSKLKSYQEAFARYTSSLESMKAREHKYLSDLEDLSNELQALVEDCEIVEELKKIVKSFISCSFDDALETIGENATKIIRCIPNMANATIQFEGQKETKDGKVKEEVNAVISMDGEMDIPIKSLSGGERSSVDLAVDLAVIDFIETNSGIGADFFILDEPFNGLDSISVEMVLEVLKNSGTNKRLMIVDHSAEVKEIVGNRLFVIRDGLTSNIQNQEVLSG